MAEKFLLEIVTPYGVEFSGEVDDVTAPGTDGEFGVLKEHTNYITTLRPGLVRFKKDAETVTYFIGSGYAEVVPDKTNILVEEAISPSDINAEEAKNELREAEEALKAVTEEDKNYKKLAYAVTLAKAKVEATQGEKSAAH